MTNDAQVITNITIFLLENFSKLTDNEEKYVNFNKQLERNKLRSGSITSLKAKEAANSLLSSHQTSNICTPFIVDLSNNDSVR